MSYNEESQASGIPTRAIHEAYLDMQRALKQYRQATDRAQESLIDNAHGEVQETVLTLYEMLRPHLKQNSAVSEYWDGKPPSYPTADEGGAPDPEDGTAILSWQVHPQTFNLNGTDPTEIRSLREWHDELAVSDTVRLQALNAENGQAFVQYQTYEMGLRHLDSWQTDFKEVENDIGGFLGGKTTTRTTRQRVPIEKLRRAGRELSDVMDQIGFLSPTKTPTIEDPEPI